MTEIQNLPERMRAMQDAFNNAPVEPSDELPEDGTYQALVHRFDFFEAKKSGDAYLKIELQIQHDRTYAGRTVDIIHNLENPDRIKWLKKDLATLGADVTNFDLSVVGPGSDALAPLLDVPVELAVVTSKNTDAEGNPYRNVYLNKRLGGPLGSSDVVGGPRVGGKVMAQTDAPAATAGLPAEKDEIPFRSRPRRDHEIRGRDLFAGDRWID